MKRTTFHQAVKQYEYKVSRRNKWIDHGFIQIPNVVLVDSDLTAGARSLLCILFVHSFNKRKCFPSNKLLCLELGVSIAQLNRYKKELYDYGVVTLEVVFDAQRNVEINIYHLNDTLPFLDKVRKKIKQRLGYDILESDVEK